jgi:hypothetical protein
LEFENKLDEYPREGTDFIDTTFEENDICQENGMPACNDRVHIIADYRHSEGEKSAKSESLNEIIKKHWQGDFHIDKREFQYGICQNRIFLEKDEAFPRSLSTFDQILSDIKADGGVVNYQQRFPKFKVNFFEKPASKELSSDAPAHMVDFMKRLEEMRKEL